MTIAPRAVWELGAALGEGPLWVAEEQALYFVDIKGGHVHRYHPGSGARKTFVTKGQPSFVLRDEVGRLLVGSEHGIFQLDDGRLGEPLVSIKQPAHNRTNDATVGPDGRLWFGTMDDNEAKATGRLYCLDKSGLHRSDIAAVVTNGPALSSDGRLLYHVDSGARTIWRFAIDETPLPHSGEVFIQLAEDEGFPDGVVVDSEDCLWVALWDGWGVRRYAPDGSLLLHVEFPCARVTKLALGGPDLRTAYVTTARVGLNREELALQPLAGSLFAFDAPALGRTLPAVRLPQISPAQTI
jgi:sugar lactone lactonase YvrE